MLESYVKNGLIKLSKPQKKGDSLGKRIRLRACDTGTFFLTLKTMKDLYGKEISQERMDEYYKELSAFENMMYEKEPKKEAFGFSGKMWPDHESEKAFNDAYSEWHMSLHCDAPNKPGYYRANND